MKTNQNLSLKCNGKCHFKKQIKKRGKKEDQSKVMLKTDNEIQLFSTISDLEIKRPTFPEESLNIKYVDGKTHELSSSIFHPQPAK